MDELQISGKRYLSSRRAAKDNGYHTDYIGQLIRGGKIKGQKVGRAWYVEEDSFLAYLGSEPAPVESAAIVAAPEPAPIVVAAPEPIVVAEQKNEIEAAPVTEEVVEKKEEIPVVVHVEPAAESQPQQIEAATPIAVRKVAPPSQGGLRYLAEDEPLLPQIPKKISATVMPRAEDLAAEAEEGPEPVPQRPRRGVSRVGMASVAVAGVLAFVAAATIGSSMFQTLKVGEDGTASTSYSIHW